MTTLLRPVKRGGTRRYTEEVAAGQPYIWEDDMDGDLDTIYAAVNQPFVLADGAVTTPKLADGAATMAKLGITDTPDLTSATIAAPVALSGVFTTICELTFTAAGGLCFVFGTLALEFDGTNQASADAEVQLRVDGVDSAPWPTPFIAIGTPFVVPIALWHGFRPPSGLHTIQIRARSTGAAGTSVRAMPTIFKVKELV